MLTLRAETVDRVFLGVCAAIWLILVGVSAAAIVALVELGTGRHAQPQGDPDAPQALYGIIALSALIIVGAVPLLIRARRAAMAPSAAELAAQGSAPPAMPARPVADLPTEKLRVFGTTPPAAESPTASDQSQDPAAKAVDRTWLRATTGVVAAMGAAMLFIMLASYLMAVDSAGAGAVALGVAAVITGAMPAVPWYFLRELRGTAGAG